MGSSVAPKRKCHNVEVSGAMSGGVVSSVSAPDTPELLGERRTMWWLFAANTVGQALMWGCGYLGFVRLAGELGGLGPTPSVRVVDGLQWTAGVAFVVVVTTALVTTGRAVVGWSRLARIQRVGACVVLVLALLVVALLAYWIYDFVTTPWEF